MAYAKIEGFGSNRERSDRVVTLWCVGAVTAGNSVMIDLSDTTYGIGNSIEQADTADSPLAFGIALETTTASAWVRVQVCGYYDGGTNVTGATIAAGAMVGAGTTGGDGRIKSAANLTASAFPFAVCLVAYGDGDALGEIMIIDRGWWRVG